MLAQSYTPNLFTPPLYHNFFIILSVLKLKFYIAKFQAAARNGTQFIHHYHIYLFI